jgi:hypothetical protein
MPRCISSRGHILKKNSSRAQIRLWSAPSAAELHIDTLPGGPETELERGNHVLCLLIHGQPKQLPIVIGFFCTVLLS